MNDEQILLDDLNAFEDFMENADVEEIKKEHGLSSNNEFKVGKFYNCYLTSRTKEQIKLSCRTNGTARIGNFTVYRYKNGEFICEKADYLSGLSYDDTYYHRIFDCFNTKRVIISTVDFFSTLSDDDLVKLYKSKFDFSILDTPKTTLEVVQGEIVESTEQVHNRICDNFAIVEKTLYEICVDLKSIRDNKHYKTLGYNTFEDYCLENFNIKRRQAYNYISIAENLSSDFVHSSAQFGVKKLYCLSRLTDEERSELIQTTDIENIPVKQLEQKSREIKENREVQIKENDVVSTAIEPQQIKEKEKDVPEVEKIVDILSMFQYFNGDTKEHHFWIYSNKFQITKKEFILNDLFSYYEYLSKFKKLFDIDINSLTNTEFDALDNVLSDFLEVSKRFDSCVYDLKQYLKEKKKELNKK